MRMLLTAGAQPNVTDKVGLGVWLLSPTVPRIAPGKHAQPTYLDITLLAHLPALSVQAKP